MSESQQTSGQTGRRKEADALVDAIRDLLYSTEDWDYRAFGGVNDRLESTGGITITLDINGGAGAVR